MWAQLMQMRAKEERISDLPELFEKLQLAEQPDSGLLRTVVLQDQKDPTLVFTIVLFESEEKARARENDPRRQEMLASAQALMKEIFVGAPEFHDANVLRDATP